MVFIPLWFCANVFFINSDILNIIARWFSMDKIIARRICNIGSGGVAFYLLQLCKRFPSAILSYW